MACRGWAGALLNVQVEPLLTWDVTVVRCLVIDSHLYLAARHVNANGVFVGASGGSVGTTLLSIPATLTQLRPQSPFAPCPTLADVRRPIDIQRCPGHVPHQA
ncbi:hypothetical protein GCM10008949_46380 [Deinococcus humi]|nr:hypothetical protein GCM10008949_46380 [Deinococcus humi]